MINTKLRHITEDYKTSDKVVINSLKDREKRKGKGTSYNLTKSIEQRINLFQDKYSTDLFEFFEKRGSTNE